MFVFGFFKNEAGDKPDDKRLYHVEKALREKSKLFKSAPADLGFVDSVSVFSALAGVLVLAEIIKIFVKRSSAAEGLHMHEKIVVLTSVRLLAYAVAAGFNESLAAEHDGAVTVRGGEKKILVLYLGREGDLSPDAVLVKKIGLCAKHRYIGMLLQLCELLFKASGISVIVAVVTCDKLSFGDLKTFVQGRGKS